MSLSVLASLRKVHDAGYIYNDLKPDNILLDFKSSNLDSVNLVDFGFATKYLDRRGEHLHEGMLQSFRGNMLTSSTNLMMFKTTSRRDDMISLLYLIIYLLNQTLPWIIPESKDMTIET
jgi:serine/threonine protein kinase